MGSKTPSFLIVRNGIFYFHARMPKHRRADDPTLGEFIRRSTSTGNKREALIIARRWAVELMDKDNKNTLDDIDAYAERRNRLYSKGRAVAEKLKLLDPNDGLEIEDFLDDLTPSEQEAFNFYQESAAQENKKFIENELASIGQALAQNIKLSYVYEKYIHHHTNPAQWAGKTLAKNKQQLSLFVEMMGDPDVSEITKTTVRERFADRIDKVPKGMNNKKNTYYNGARRKPIDEAIKIAAQQNAETLSPTGMADHAKNIRSFLRWAEEQDYIGPNTYIVLKRFDKMVDRDSIKEKKFTDDDLRNLFQNDSYLSGKLMKKPFQHWTPLIALFTGAREGEICQLHLDDIRWDEDAKTWYVDFNSEKGKKLKNKHSERAVPIHTELIKLGFLKYVEQLRGRNETQLFPTLSADQHGNWGRHVSRWFNGNESNGRRIQGFKDICGILSSENERKNFHSFRHSFIDYGKQNHTNGEVLRELTGHSVGKKDVHARVYEQSYNMKIRKKVINDIKLDINFENIKKWPA